MITLNTMIEHLKDKKPIKVILDGLDLGIFTYNPDEERYEGFGYLTLETIKKILYKKIDYMKIEMVKK